MSLVDVNLGFPKIIIVKFFWGTDAFDIKTMSKPPPPEQPYHTEQLIELLQSKSFLNSVCLKFFGCYEKINKLSRFDYNTLNTSIPF